MTEIAYARAGDTHVAFRVTGDPGGVDVVMVAGAFFPFEMLEEDRVAGRFMAGLASLGRLVVFDNAALVCRIRSPIGNGARNSSGQMICVR